MAQAIAEELGRAPMSAALQATLMRAREYASGQSHNQVTVEHLLLALSEDDDAALVLQSSRVDIGRLRHDVADYLGNLGDRSPGPTQPVVAPQLAEILKYATLAAKQGRRAKIDGAIVLAALVGDGRSMAASFLNAQGLTFEEAIRVLQRAAAPAATAASAATSAPARSEPQQAQAESRNGANAEDILAAARDRVGRRTPALRPEPVVPPRAEPRPETRPEKRQEPKPESRAERDIDPSADPNRDPNAGSSTGSGRGQPFESHAPQSNPGPAPEGDRSGPSYAPQMAANAAYAPEADRAHQGERLPAVAAPQPQLQQQPQPVPARAETPAFPPAVPEHEPSAYAPMREAPANPHYAGMPQSHGTQGPVAAQQGNAHEHRVVEQRATEHHVAEHRATEHHVADQHASRPQAAAQPADVAQPATSEHAPRAPSPTWAPPPLPVPPQHQAQAHLRPPPPALGTGRAPLAHVPGPPEWTNRPDTAPPPPWSDPVARPLAGPYSGQQIGAGGPAAGHYAPQGQSHVRPAMSGPFPAGPGTSGPGFGAGVGPVEGPRAPAIEPSQVSHTIPKRMRVGSKTAVEVRIARAAIAGGSAGPRPASLRAELTAFRTISVRLRGTKSAFAIDAGSQETQWDQAIGPTGRLAGDVAVWRFNISPLKAMRADLHLVATARTVGADGVIADTVLPDQVVNVRIGRDIGKTMRRFAGGSTIAIVSIAALKLTEEFLGFDLLRLIRALIGI